MPSLIEPVVVRGRADGPRLIVLGAVHGNEVAGTRGIEHVLAELSGGALRIARGHVTFVPVTNRLAYEKGTRNGDRNLNRNLAPANEPHDNEDRIANELCPLLGAHDVLLDLHSFQSPGSPFVMLGPGDNDGALQPFKHAADEEALAVRLGVARAVDGWLDTYAKGVQRRGGAVKYGIGTTEFMRSAGGYAVTLECGQHDDPEAPSVARRAIMNTLLHLGLVEGPKLAPVARIESLRLCEVVDRHHAADAFERRWKSFDRVAAGEAIAKRHDGAAVTAPSDGFIVFPNEKSEPGTEWFYFARASERLAHPH